MSVKISLTFFLASALGLLLAAACGGSAEPSRSTSTEAAAETAADPSGGQAGGATDELGIGVIDDGGGMPESETLPTPEAANAGELESGIDGIVTVPIDSVEHVREDVEYSTSPPAGGPHLPVWLNCGYYEVAVLDELAVHSLEHGVVWVTFRPDASPEEELAELRRRVNRTTHLLASPYQDQETAFVLTAWGRQLPLNSITDPRFERFLDVYLKDSPSAPEPGAACNGSVGVPPDAPYAQSGG